MVLISILALLLVPGVLAVATTGVAVSAAAVAVGAAAVQGAVAALYDDWSKYSYFSNSNGGSTDLKPQNLMNELKNSGVKYNPDDVLMITKTRDGKLMWLEKGNSKSGFRHILDRHSKDFSNKGITDIPDFLNKVLQSNPN